MLFATNQLSPMSLRIPDQLLTQVWSGTVYPVPLLNNAWFDLKQTDLASFHLHSQKPNLFILSNFTLSHYLAQMGDNQA